MPWEIFDPSEPNENVFFGGSGSPSTRLAPNFNGISQYADIPNISLSTGDSVSLYIEFDNIASNFILFSGTSADWNDSARCGVINGLWYLTGGTAEINGNPVSHGDAAVISSGRNHIKWIKTSASTVDIVRIGSDASSRFCYFPIFNFSVNDGSAYNFPMDDGWPNNPTMRNTGTGPDGTFINMTEAAWVEIPV